MAEITYAKKRLEPIIKKYSIDVDTDIVFKSIISLFDKQTDYQMWALKLVYERIVNVTKLIELKSWLETNSSDISLLSKKNAISYKTHEDIAKLDNEIKCIDAYRIVKTFVSRFNTAQRRVLKSHALDIISNPCECLCTGPFKNIKALVDGFNLLPSHRQQKFISLMSAVTSFDSIMRHLKDSLEESYDWSREELLSFAQRNCKDVDICYDKDNIVILQIPSFESAKKLCGDGITSWCLTRERSYFERYTKNNNNARQFFLFDFNKDEKDNLSHIGFSVNPTRGITDAHSTRNNSLTGDGIRINDEYWNIDKILSSLNIDKSVYISLKKLQQYDWNKESFIRRMAFLSGVEVKEVGDGRLIVPIKSSSIFKVIFEHTLICDVMPDDSHELFAVLDFSKDVKDGDSIILVVFRKDRYGTHSFESMIDAYHVASRDFKDMEKRNLTTETFIDLSSTDINVLLHKFIDEGNIKAAIKLIQNEKDLDPNNVFYGSMAAIKAIAQGHSDLFEALLNHPKFDITLTEAFGEPYPHFLLLAMEAKLNDNKSITPWIEMCLSILANPKFDINTVNVNDDTVLHTACESSEFLPIVKYLVERVDVNINKVNDWGFKPIDVAIGCDKPNIEAIRLLLTRPDLMIDTTTTELANAKKIDLSILATKPTEKSYAGIFAKYIK